MPRHRRPRIRRGAAFFAALGWSLALTGCHHPLAQRTGGNWSPRRVVTHQADQDQARVRPVSKGGFYALVREWDAQGRVSADTAPPGELAQAYLDPGELLGFRRTGPGRVIAVFGPQEVEIQLDPGVHHVWYRERTAWSHAGSTTFWLGALGVAAVVGLVVLLANSDDSRVNINVN